MSPSEKAELFAAWQEQRLTQSQGPVFESLCCDDKEFAETLALNKVAELLSAEYRDESIPEWPRHQDKFNILRDHASSKEPFNWLSLSAFAMSLLAMIMVMSNFQIQFSDGQLKAGFRKQNASTQHDLADELKAIQNAEREWYQAQINQLRKEQKQANVELTAYLLDSNRKAQQDAFSQIVQLLNVQRREDQQYYTDQLRRVQSIMQRQEERAWSNYRTAEKTH